MRSPQHPRQRRRDPRAAGRIVAWALAATVGLIGAPARARLPAIRWEAPAGCPTAQQVEARVAAVVGERPVSAAVTAVHARVQRDGEGWLLVVRFTGRDGSTERRLALHACEATADATALLVAIALVGAPGETTVPGSTAGDEPAGTTGAATAPAEPQTRAIAPELPGAVPVGPDDAASEGRSRASMAGAGDAGDGAPSGDGRGRASALEGADAEGRGRASARGGVVGEGRGRASGRGGADAEGRGRASGRDGADGQARGRASRSPRTPRGFVQAGPAVAIGVLPRATPGLLLALGAAWPRLRLSLGYGRWFRSSARWPEDRSLGADLSLHVATVRVGPVRRVGPVELHAGLGLELGALRAAGVGNQVNLDGRTWWGATLLGGALAWAPRALRGHGALLLQAELVAPLHRPALLHDDTPIFRPGALGLRVGVQLEARVF